MGWRGLLVCVLAMASLAACVSTPAARNAAIITKVAAGEGDPCDGSGWARTQLLRDDEALVSLRRAVAARLDQEQGDAALPETAARLAGLENTLRALTEMERRGDWPALRAGAERWVNDTHRRAQAYAGTTLAATRARLAVYSAAAQSNQDYREESAVGASLRGCRLTPLHRAARFAYGAALIDVMTTRGWPQDAIDGEGAALDALAITPQLFSAADLESACTRLERAARDGPLPPGAWTHLRVQLACANGWETTPDAYIARFATEWPALAAFLESVPRPSLADDLRLRVALEQYGRHIRDFDFANRFDAAPTAAQMAEFNVRIAAADAANTAYLKALLERRDWFDDAVDGAGAQSLALLIVQHADADLAFQAEMLQRLERYVGAGRVARMNFAFLWDRVAVAEGRPQRFATQVTCEAGAIVPAGGVEDAAGLDQRRAAYDFLQTWDEYRDMMRVLTGCRAAAGPSVGASPGVVSGAP